MKKLKEQISYAVKKGLVSQEKVSKTMSKEWKDKTERFYPKVEEMKEWVTKLP